VQGNCSGILVPTTWAGMCRSTQFLVQHLVLVFWICHPILSLVLSPMWTCCQIHCNICELPFSYLLELQQTYIRHFNINSNKVIKTGINYGKLWKSPYSKPLGSLGKLNPCGICRFVERSLFLTIRTTRFNSFKTIFKQELMNTCLMYVIDYLIGSFNYDIRW